MRLVHQDQPIGMRYPAQLPGSGYVSQELELVMQRISCHLRVPAAAYGANWYMREEIARVEQEAAENDWDGDGAQAVAPGTAAFAKDFIEVLPPGIATPVIEAGAHGEITLEWRPGKRRVLLVSLYPDRTVGYAVVRGFARSYGREPFSDVLSEPLLAHLKSILQG